MLFKKIDHSPKKYFFNYYHLLIFHINCLTIHSKLIYNLFYNPQHLKHRNWWKINIFAIVLSLKRVTSMNKLVNVVKFIPNILTIQFTSGILGDKTIDSN